MFMKNIMPIESLISKNYKRTTGKDVWKENLRIAVFAADKIRSSLGPRGSYKLVTYNRGPEQVVKITKDAIAILDELAIQYPPAVIISESAKIQRQEAGDGVATFVVFLSALLKKADELFALKIHPNTIIHGYNLATNRALELIDQQSSTYDSLAGEILDVVDCKRNLLSTKMRSMIMEAYQLAINKGKSDKDNIRFLRKPGGGIQESNLIKGIVVKKEKAHPNMPDKMNKLRIAITTERPGINRLEVKMPGQGPVHFKVNLKNPEQIRQFKETTDKIRSASLDRLIELKVNVLLCEQPLEQNLKDKLLAEGIFALEGVDKKDTLAVANATGARIVGQLSELIEEDLGFADALNTDSIELEKTVTIHGCKGATFLLRGSVSQAVDELETAIFNSIIVLKIMSEDNRVLAGGGAIEAHITQELRDFARHFPSKEQIVIQAFGDALMDIPRCLATNYGLNATDTLLELRKHQAEERYNMGIDAQGCAETVCLEPIRVKRSVIRRANEVSMLMLHIDELLISKEIPKFHKK
jgi:archaeal chaperonin